MPRTILHLPARPSATHYLVFLITGNPGLVGYYETFLGTLHQLLSSEPFFDEGLGPAFHIFGQSLPGFEDDKDEEQDEVGRQNRGGRRAPYGLEEVIDGIFDLLKAQRISVSEREGEPFDGVILVGHSVGCYILLELLRKARLETSARHLNIKAGILLFPTITHIAQSPSGVKISALFRIPEAPRIASILVKVLFWPLPRSILRWLVATVTGMPENSTEVTLGLLMGEKGVLQALHMARDEMRIITGDRWDEYIWGIEQGYSPEPRESVPKLVFYFGQNDHWVADQTRDALIEARAQSKDDAGGKPKMIIDLDGIPHGFCIEHGELVAEKVKVWIDEILQKT